MSAIRSVPHTTTRNKRGDRVPTGMHITVNCGQRGMTAHIPCYGFDPDADNYYTNMTFGEPKWSDRATSSDVSAVSGSDRSGESRGRTDAPASHRSASRHSDRTNAPASHRSASDIQITPMRQRLIVRPRDIQIAPMRQRLIVQSRDTQIVAEGHQHATLVALNVVRENRQATAIGLNARGQ